MYINDKMEDYIRNLDEINITMDFKKYKIIQKLINTDYCTNLINIMQTTDNNVYRNILIKLLIEITSFDIGRKEISRFELSGFLCDILNKETVEEYIIDVAVLIGNIGISDSIRPTLFNHNVSIILINILNRLSHVESKVKILKVIKMLCQTRVETQEFLKLGLVSHLLDTLSKIDTMKLKVDLIHQIYWIAYLCNNKDIINNTDCINIMYNVAESIISKSLQSQIFTYMHYFIKDKTDYTNYSLYNFWKNNFNEYLRL
jgi:hypothetical protein